MTRIGLADFETDAAACLPAAAHAYVAGGAGDELTLAANVAAWRDRELVPRVLRPTGAHELSVEVLGRPWSHPVAVAPTAFQRLSHPEGESEMARGAARARAPMCLSTLATTPIGEVVAAAPEGEYWFQLYVLRDRGLTWELVARARDCGCTALVVTVDLPVAGVRERERRHPATTPAEAVASLAGNVSGTVTPEQLTREIDANLDWDDIARLASDGGLPLIVKGILSPLDAQLAAEHGAAAVIVSNHGGGRPARYPRRRRDPARHRRRQGAGARRPCGAGRPPGAVGSGGQRRGRGGPGAGDPARRIRPRARAPRRPTRAGSLPRRAGAVKILLTGISGYVGAALAPRLRQDGHTVRGMSRRGVSGVAGIEAVAADALTGEGLEPALANIDVAYYLIHSMEPSADGSFEARERRAAEQFVAAAQDAGVKRIVYLGGLVPAEGAASQHLSSRLAVERILLESMPASVAFRASIIIGARSRSFRFMVRLVERLPVLALPGWHPNRTQPIDERDVVEILAQAASAETIAGQSLDIAGRDVVSYGDLIERIRFHMLVGRPTVSFRKLTATPIASRIASVIASEQHELIGPLMEGLETDLLPRDERAASLLGVRVHSLDAAIERALREWERDEPLRAR